MSSRLPMGVATMYSVVLLKAVSSGDGSPGSKNVMEKSDVGGVEIPEPGQRFCLHRHNLAERRQSGHPRHRIADRVERPADEDGLRPPGCLVQTAVEIGLHPDP